MKFEISQRSLNQALQGPQDALLVLWADGAGQTGLLADWVAQARARGDFKDTAGAVLQSYGMPGVKPRHLVLVSCVSGTQVIRKAVRAAWGSLKADGVKSLAIQWVGADLSAADVQALVTELADASYAYTATLSKPKARQLQKVQIGTPKLAAAQSQALVRAQATVQGIELAKEWANRPANHATPTHLAKAAQALSKAKGVSCKVLGPREVQKLGMGAFLAVAQGAVEPLRFIVLEYKGPKASGAPVVLVGKGITFDTGGISMKPAAEMDEMKL